jgi:hypothetical protein
MSAQFYKCAREQLDMREDGAPTPQESTLFGVHSSMKPQPVMQQERCRGGKGSQPPKLVGSQEAINHNSKVEKMIQKQDTSSVFVGTVYLNPRHKSSKARI